ncbi:hypothetical protein Tco_0210551 [Tanacetum coccineum]
MGLWYPKNTGFELTAFSDSDHAGCFDSRKSTSGGIQFLGGDKLVSWSSKKQDCTSMSSASREALAILCNPVQHYRTKHTDVRYHFIKEHVEKGIVELFFVGTEYQLADLFTKALSEDRFKYIVRRLGMRCLTPEELEIISRDNTNLIESLLNRNTLIDSSSKIDSLLDEFAGELTLLKSIPPGIDDDNLDLDGEIHLVERLLYDNSSPRPPEELNVENYIESFSPSLIPVKDSNSLMVKIDVFLAPDDSIPLGIESDDFNSECDDNSTSLPEFKSFHVDYLDSRDSTINVVEDIPVDVPNILPTHPTLHIDFNFIPSHNDLKSDLDVSSPSGYRNKIYDLGICIEVKSTRFIATLSPVIDTLLPFSSENEDKVFNHGVLTSKEKSPPSSSHRGFKTSKLFHHKSPMLTHGDKTPNLGVRHPHFYPP